MPHVILKGPVTAEDIWLSFRPMEFHEGEAHCKAQDCLLSADRKTALIRSLVVEGTFAKSFLTRVVEKEDTLTLGLDPLGTPERTEAVKRFLGFCAWTILQASPEMHLAGGTITDLVRGPAEA